MQFLNEVLIRNLRQGDVTCRWNEAQFLALLRELNHKQTEEVIQRIDRKFRDHCEQSLRGRILLQATPLSLIPTSNDFNCPQ